MDCVKPLDEPLHSSSLLFICDNDKYQGNKSGERRRSKKNSMIDMKKIDADIRRVLLLAQYRPINLVVCIAILKYIVLIILCISRIHLDMNSLRYRLACVH